MTLSQVLTFYKTKAAIARALGISPASVSEWWEIDPDTGEPKGVPKARQYQLQVLSNGALQVAE